MTTRPEDQIRDWQAHASSGRYLVDAAYKRLEVVALARKVDDLGNKFSTEDAEAQKAMLSLRKALGELDKAERLSSHYKEQAYRG